MVTKQRRPTVDQARKANDRSIKAFEKDKVPAAVSLRPEHRKGADEYILGEHEQPSLFDEPAGPQQGRFWGNEVGSRSAADPSRTNRALRLEHAVNIATRTPQTAGQRIMGVPAKPTRTPERAEIALTAYHSAMPYQHLQRADESQLATGPFKTDLVGRGATAYYRGDQHSIAVRGDRLGDTNSVVHELGHAQHYASTHHPSRSGEGTRTGGEYQRAHFMAPYAGAPSPTLEGVAVGYADRYGHKVSEVGLRGSDEEGPSAYRQAFQNLSGRPMTSLNGTPSTSRTGTPPEYFEAARAITRHEGEVPDMRRYHPETGHGAGEWDHPALNSPQFDTFRSRQKTRAEYHAYLKTSYLQEQRLL